MSVRVVLVSLVAANLKKGEACTINTDDKEPLRQEINAKMAKPVFGHLKNSNFRGFSIRSKEKVAGKFSLLVQHTISKSLLTLSFLFCHLHSEMKS